MKRKRQCTSAGLIMSVFRSLVPRGSPTFSLSGASSVFLLHQAPALCTPLFVQARSKMTRRQSYDKPARASPNSHRMPNKHPVGVRAISSEYVEKGQTIQKQRKYISKNVNVTRNRHVKMYPGENVVVFKDTSIGSKVSGRVKYTHDVSRDVLLVNVLPEPREELLREELWRYRTEHVDSLEHNKLLISTRQKFLPHFPRPLVNPPFGPRPLPTKVADWKDRWNPVTLRDPMEMEPLPYAMTGRLLRRHLRKQKRLLAGLQDDDPTFQHEDVDMYKYGGNAQQR